MKIEGKDFLEWLHEIRKKNWKGKDLSIKKNIEFAKKTKKEAEKILNTTIRKIDAIRK